MEEVRKLLKQAFDLALENGALIKSAEFEVISYQTSMNDRHLEVRGINLDCTLFEKRT